MNKKSFFFGFVTGIVLTLVVIIIIAIVSYKSGETDPVHFLDQPVSYEHKTETSFKVFQVIKNAALATEASDEFGDEVMYFGNTVLIPGEGFYTDQIVTIKNPKRVGTYSYTNKGGVPMTVPVVNGEME